MPSTSIEPSEKEARKRLVSQILSVFETGEGQEALQRIGLSEGDFLTRLETLSEAELARVEARATNLHAGGNLMGVVVLGIAGLFFLVWLFSDFKDLRGIR